MAAYFDSSVLLSLLLGDANACHAQALWHSELHRVSSTLVNVECITLLRRAIPARLGAARRKERENRLSTALEEVTLKALDEDISSQSPLPRVILTEGESVRCASKSAGRGFSIHTRKQALGALWRCWGLKTAS